MKKIKLSEDIKYWRAERPDESTMDEFVRAAQKLERELSEFHKDKDYTPTLEDILKIASFEFNKDGEIILTTNSTPSRAYTLRNS